MKTYGVRSSVVYNMKSTPLCIVILITCSGYVSAELEFYPDYQRPDITEEEWVREVPTNQDFSSLYDEPRSTFSQNPQLDMPYLNLYKPADLTWPNIATQNLLRKQNLANRIQEMTRNLEETDRRPQYYFKTSRVPEDRLNNYNIFQDRKAGGDFVPMSKPNFRILDDIRLNADKDSSDFIFSLDSLEDGDKNFMDSSNEEGLDGSKSYVEDIFSDAKLVDDPTEFAYPPSDPRYFENPDVTESQTPNHVKVREDKSNSAKGLISDRQRTNENYRTSPIFNQNSEDVSEVVALKQNAIDYTTGVYIIAIVAGISAAATVGLIAFGIGWYNLQKHVKNTSDVEYPAYGVTGPNKDISPSGDRRLAQSAQMYHYQHQKQQIIAMESRAAANERHGSLSEADSDEENEEGDYTVYECPGLAPTGEMEVKNPLFHDDPTPAQTPALKISENNVQKK